MWHGHLAHEYVDVDVDVWHWQNQSGQSQLQMTDLDGFLDGLFGQIFGTDFLDRSLGGFWTDFGLEIEVNKPWPSIWQRSRLRAGDDIVVGIPLYFSGVCGHFRNPHLNFTSGWWQVVRSMSPPFEPDPCLEHACVTFCRTVSKYCSVRVSPCWSFN